MVHRNRRGGLRQLPGAATDAADDHLDSVSSNTAAFTGAEVDFSAYGAQQLDFTQAQADETSSTYPCGQSDATRTVVCVDGDSDPLPQAPIDTFFMQLAAPVPTDDAGKSYIYSVVLDSDGKADDDWSPSPLPRGRLPGCRPRVQLSWDHTDRVWSLTATRVDADQTTTSVASTARSVIEGDTITFFVSASELPANIPATGSPPSAMTVPTCSSAGDVSGETHRRVATVP